MTVIVPSVNLLPALGPVIVVAIVAVAALTLLALTAKGWVR